MAGDKDVLGKADALLRRHAVAPPGSGADTGGVPLLTDFVELPEASAATADAGALARDIRAEVLAALEGRLAAELEKRLAQQLAGQAHAAVVRAVGDVRQELAEAVARAVDEALARRPVK